jgi:hypothetical protein
VSRSGDYRVKFVGEATETIKGENTFYKRKK